MDAEYLKTHVGSVLTDALTSVVLNTPADPISHIVQYLRHTVKQRNDEIEQQKLQAAALQQDQLLHQKLQTAAEKQEAEQRKKQQLVNEQYQAFDSIFAADYDNETTLFTTFVQHLQTITQATGVYIGEVKHTDSSDSENERLIQYVAANPSHEFMLTKRLTEANENDENDNNRQAGSVTFSILSPYQPQPDFTEQDEADEENEELSVAERQTRYYARRQEYYQQQPLQSVYIPNVLVSKKKSQKIHFFKDGSQPGLGSFYACRIHLPHRYLNGGTLDYVVEHESEIRQQRQDEIEEEKERQKEIAAERRRRERDEAGLESEEEEGEHSEEGGDEEQKESSSESEESSSDSEDDEKSKRKHKKGKDSKTRPVTAATSTPAPATADDTTAAAQQAVDTQAAAIAAAAEAKAAAAAAEEQAFYTYLFQYLQHPANASANGADSGNGIPPQSRDLIVALDTLHQNQSFTPQQLSDIQLYTKKLRQKLIELDLKWFITEWHKRCELQQWLNEWKRKEVERDDRDENDRDERKRLAIEKMRKQWVKENKVVSKSSTSRPNSRQQSVHSTAADTAATSATPPTLPPHAHMTEEDIWYAIQRNTVVNKHKEKIDKLSQHRVLRGDIRVLLAVFTVLRYVYDQQSDKSVDVIQGHVLNAWQEAEWYGKASTLLQGDTLIRSIQQYDPRVLNHIVAAERPGRRVYYKSLTAEIKAINGIVEEIDEESLLDENIVLYELYQWVTAVVGVKERLKVEIAEQREAERLRREEEFEAERLRLAQEGEEREEADRQRKAEGEDEQSEGSQEDSDQEDD